MNETNKQKKRNFGRSLAAVPRRIAASVRKFAQKRRWSVTTKATVMYGIIFALVFTGLGVLLVVSYRTYLLGSVEPEKVGAMLAPLAILLLILLAFGLALTLALGGLVVRGMLTPVKKMIATAKEIDTASLSTRIETGSSEDELYDLAAILNGMLDRLQSAFDRQNRFISDVSHELRTPIAVVQGYSELLSRWGSAKPEVLKEAIDAITAEAHNMKSLVEKLLFLARADKKTLIIQPESFHMDELINEIVTETRLITQKEIVAGQIEPLTVLADRALIKQAIRVFMENSVKYSGADGRITLSCYEDGGRCAVVVSDNGIGISETDLPHIFERFYKADASRRRDGGSAGLGLAIAKWIADAHEAELDVSSKPGIGATVRLLV
ncbi:MAG: HAMP domain-containing histidine kinase [Clostridiales bacterium]|jgi:signal transduction histidine kinase|nr:HAMP domain-containing histidine kinase [Clostridiales bacterium]